MSSVGCNIAKMEEKFSGNTRKSKESSCVKNLTGNFWSL
jgi:hypothetical protein